MANAIGAPFAHFLTPDDYSAGQRASNADVNAKIGQFTNAYNIGTGIQDRQFAVAQRDDNKNQIDMGRVVEAAKWGADNKPQQAPQPMQTVAQPEASAPAPAPAPEPAQTFPVSSTPSTMAPQQPASPQYAAPTQAPAQVTPTPAATAPAAPTTAPAAPTTAPAAPTTPAALPTPTTVPPAPVSQPSVAQDLRARLKAMTTDAAANDQGILKQLVDSGKITPDFAQRYAANAAALRDKQAERVIETETKVQAIATSDLNNREKQVKIAKEVRGAEDNSFNDVYSALSRGGIQAAKMTAKEIGLDIDLSDPRQLATLETRAKRSSEYKEIATQESNTAKNAREQEKADREALGVGTGKDVPAGLREVMVRGADGTPQVAYVDANGKRVSQEEITKLSLAGKKAGASSTSIGGQAAGVNADGTVSLAKIDKYGNKVIPATTVKELKATENNARIATSLLPVLDEALKVADTAPSSGIGNKVADVSSFIGVKTDATLARETLNRATTQAVSLIATIDPRAKGAPSNADIEGIKKILNDPNSEPSQKKAAIATVQGWAKQMVAEHSDAFASIDDESKKMLRAQGIGGPDKAAPPTAPSKKEPATKNTKGWALMKDAKGNFAYVGPRGEIEEVK